MKVLGIETSCDDSAVGIYCSRRKVLASVLAAQIEQLGGSPQKMSFKEVYGGLQRKVIDGEENT